MLYISPQVRDKIIQFEVSSQSWYEKFAARPTWPGGGSGITIGVGYDLGQHTKEEFRADWLGTHTGNSSDLAACCGVKGQQASWLVHTVAFISVPYAEAEMVFNDVVLPRYIELTAKTFPNCDQLPIDAFGALVDLVYNRGNDTSDTDRRREMLQIKSAMAHRAFESIPGYIRSMKRLWHFSAGLQARREWEATTFEQAIRKLHPAVVQPVLPGIIHPDDNIADELNEQELERVRRQNYGPSDPLGR